jgi:Mrp family chromosome partitioning ATPase
VANASHAQGRNDAPEAIPQVWYQEAWLETETEQPVSPTSNPSAAQSHASDDFVTDEEIQMTSVRSSHLSPAAIEAIQRVETLKAAMEKLSNRIDQYKFTESNHSFQVRDKSSELNQPSVEVARVVTENYRASQTQLRQEAKTPAASSNESKSATESSRSNAPVADHPDTASRFQAVWEVDRFYWPDVTTALSQDPDFDLASIGKNLVRAHQTGLRTILITSLERSEGRSTVAMCLARCASRAGLKVALLDGDLSNPALVDHLNLDVTHPWTDTIFEDLRLEDAAIHSIHDQITFLPSGKDVDDRQLRKHQNRIVAMLQSLAQEFDLIVVDGDPISSLGFTLLDLASAHAFDSAVMVVDQRERPMRELEDAVKQIRQRGIQSVGIVENFR